MKNPQAVTEGNASPNAGVGRLRLLEDYFGYCVEMG